MVAYNNGSEEGDSKDNDRDVCTELCIKIMNELRGHCKSDMKKELDLLEKILSMLTFSAVAAIVETVGVPGVLFGENLRQILVGSILKGMVSGTAKRKEIPEELVTKLVKKDKSDGFMEFWETHVEGKCGGDGGDGGGKDGEGSENEKGDEDGHIHFYD